jgi:hypothetical protein
MISLDQCPHTCANEWLHIMVVIYETPVVRSATGMPRANFTHNETKMSSERKNFE